MSVCGNVLTGTMREPFALAPTTEPLIMLIADGMGGHARGDVASRTALKILMDRELDCRTLSDWVDALHAAPITASTTLWRRTLMPSDLGRRGGRGREAQRPNGLQRWRQPLLPAQTGGLVRLSVDDTPLGTAGSQLHKTTHQITQYLRAAG